MLIGKLFIFLLPLFLYANEVCELVLTPQEKQFIANAQSISYVYDPDWAPFEYKDGINHHVGIVADILKVIEQKSGLHFEAIPSVSWDKALKKVQNAEVDMVSALTQTQTREKYLNFTKNSFFSVPYIFVSRNNEYFADGFNSLGNAKLAVVKGYAITAILKKNYPNVHFEEVSSIQEGFLKLQSKDIDVFLLNKASAEYAINQHGYKNLAISYTTEYVLPLKIALRKEYSPLALSIIDKTIKSISDDELQSIYKKWEKSYENVSRVYLSKKEEEWIKMHPSISFVGDPNWLPFEAFDKSGEYIGIVSEYLHEIQKATGLKFKIVQTKSWEESLSLIKNHKVDMISETVDSDMKKYLLFSESYLHNHIVIVMKNDARYVDSLEMIEDKKVAFIKGYGYVAKIKKAYPNIHFIEVQNIHEGLDAVATSEVDALLSTMALASYNIDSGGFSNLKIVGKTEFSTSLGYGVQKEMAPLVGILNKAIELLENSKRQEILKKWTMQKYVEKIDYTLAWEVFAGAIVLLTLFWFWSMRLKKEIARRVVLEAENEKMLEQQAKYAALGEMMDAVAHQWKQPLNAIVMMSELLLIDYEEGSLDKAYLHEYKNDIDAQVEHLLSTLSEFRTFFRPDKEAEEFNILESINAILLLVKDEFIKNAILIEIQCDVTLTLHQIQNEFKHILLNIINNAKDAFVDNDISDRKIMIKVSKKAGNIEITISDNAGGIPANILPKIFEANVTSKAQGKGTGIGLYMSKKIADKMSATLSAKNVADGAVFKLTLPA